LPPVRTSQPSSTSPPPQEQPSQGPPNPALSDLQSQLHNTQTSLAAHVERIRALEGVLAEHEAIKREVSALREMMEERRRAAEGAGSQDANGSERSSGENDDDDARSINTIVPHELDRVDEEDEDQLAAEEEEEEHRRQRREELGRPRTPEPTGLGMSEEDYEPHQTRLLSAPRRRSLSPESREKSPSVIDELTTRLSTLSDQLESALVLSSTLQAQHAAAQDTITALEGKVSALESLVHATQAQTAAQGLAHDQTVREAAAAAAAAAVAAIPSKDDTRESFTQMLNEWKKGVEGQWSSVQEEWTQERERLSRAREEWESKFKAVELGLGSAVAKVDAGLASINSSQTQRHLPNGDAKHGLVTPPSPRSLSSDSNRPRQRRRRSAASRGRSRSRSHSQPRTDASDELTDSSTAVSLSGLQLKSSKVHSPHSDADDESDVDEDDRKESRSDLTLNGHARYLATPAPSVHTLSSSQSTNEPSKGEMFELEQVRRLLVFHQTLFTFLGQYPMTVSTAVGVLVLGVAAAAVMWRVKPE
jgi:hypothetical protein